HVGALRLEELEQRHGALAERHLGRVPRLAGLAEEGVLEARDALAGDRVARHRRAHLLRDREAELLDLAARDQRLGLGALDLALLEGDLVELGMRDVPLAGARLAHAHRLAVAVEVLARQAQALARFEEGGEAGAQLEGEPSLEIRALGRRRLLAALRRRAPRAALAWEQDLLREPDLGHDRVTHAEAARVGPPEGKV